MISIFKNKSLKWMLVLVMAAFVFALAGCNNGGGGEVTEKYTVIYDGNGGYLGNKTYTIRKLQVAENSKIPKYLSEYTQDQYVVSSLGLATRQGYNLKGWYLEENATYTEDEFGAYVYLDLEDGNGVYNIDELGDYVYGYLLDEEGDLIFINVEAMTDDDDPETTEYIFYQGGNGLGFYIYNSEDAEHVAVYEVDGGYSPSQLSKYGTSYLVFDELTLAEQTLFAEIPRYKQAFYEYTEADEGLTRYSLESGYIYLDTTFEENATGNYVAFDGGYVQYDDTNPEHVDLDRYSISDRVVFTPTVDVESPADLTRYNATITYWDFEKDRVTEDITLLAHWERKLTVYYVQKSGQVTTITTKLSDDRTTQIDLKVGETIGGIEAIPLYAGYTFVGWSTSETEYLPWDFDTDVFPSTTTELYLYAYMIEGTYTRITSASGLSKVVNNPSGNYLLVKDIDLNGTIYYNKSPLGFELKTSLGAVPVVFTGKFVSMGYKISNFTLNVQNMQKTINKDEGVVIVSALFPYVQNATISGVIVENASAVLSTSATATSVVCDLGVAGLVGTALDGNTVITDVSVEMTITPSSTTSIIDYPMYVGYIVARGAEYTTITEATATIDYSALTGMTTSDLLVTTLN